VSSLSHGCFILVAQTENHDVEAASLEHRVKMEAGRSSEMVVSYHILFGDAIHKTTVWIKIIFTKKLRQI